MESMKYDKVIAGPLLVNCYLPTSCWGQVDMSSGRTARNNMLSEALVFH